MAGDTASAALRDLLLTTKDGDWGKESPESDAVPYRVIRGTDFPAVRIGDTSSVPVRYLSEATVHRRTLRPDDILLETAGGSPGRPTGRSLLITERLLSSLDRPATCASFARFLRVDPKKAVPHYVYWHLQYLYASGQMEEHQVQHTGVARFQYTRFAETEQIPLPARDEQRAIAHILGTLDDKIELNRRMNETLEAMARAPFKSWFVDFDPVRAKAEGRNPGLPKPLGDLFPARLVDSELGEIPEGWLARTVEDVCSTVTRGVTPKYEEGSRRYIINQRVNRGAHLDLAELKELAPALDVPADCYAKRWDVLINCLGEGTLGRVHLFKGKSDTYAVDQHMSICRGITSGAGAYLYQVLVSPAGQEKIESLKTGSTGMTMFNISKLRGFDFLWPGDALIAAYFRIAEPELARTTNSEEQSHTLAALRDALLPKLISGEVLVKDAEKFVGRAV